MPVAGSWPSHARCGRFGCPTRCWVTVGLERWRNGLRAALRADHCGGLFPRRCVINGWKRWFQVSNDGGKICFAGWPRRMGDQSRSCTLGPRRSCPKLSVHRLLLCGDSVPNTRNSSERHRQDGLQDRFVSGHCPTRCCRPTKKSDLLLSSGPNRRGTLFVKSTSIWMISLRFVPAMSVSILWHRSKWNWPTAASQHPFSNLVAATPSKDVHLIFWVHSGMWALNTLNSVLLVSKTKKLLGGTEWVTRWGFVASKPHKRPTSGGHWDS